MPAAKKTSRSTTTTAKTRSRSTQSTAKKTTGSRTTSKTAATPDAPDLSSLSFALTSDDSDRPLVAAIETALAGKTYGSFDDLCRAALRSLLIEASVAESPSDSKVPASEASASLTQQFEGLEARLGDRLRECVTADFAELRDRVAQLSSELEQSEDPFPRLEASLETLTSRLKTLELSPANVEQLEKKISDRMAATVTPTLEDLSDRLGLMMDGDDTQNGVPALLADVKDRVDSLQQLLATETSSTIPEDRADPFAKVHTSEESAPPESATVSDADVDRFAALLDDF